MLLDVTSHGVGSQCDHRLSTDPRLAMSHNLDLCASVTLDFAQFIRPKMVLTMGLGLFDNGQRQFWGFVENMFEWKRVDSSASLAHVLLWQSLDERHHDGVRGLIHQGMGTPVGL